MGKSSLAFQIALHNIKRNKGVVIDSLEMSSEDALMRMIAQENQESISDLLSGYIKDLNSFKKTLKYFSNNKYLHIDDKVLTFSQLKSKYLIFMDNFNALDVNKLLDETDNKLGLTLPKS